MRGNPVQPALFPVCVRSPHFSVARKRAHYVDRSMAVNGVCPVCVSASSAPDWDPNDAREV